MLVTYIIDYRCGTYVRQCFVPAATDMIRCLIDLLQGDPDMPFGRSLSEGLEENLSLKLFPSVVDDLVGVWCISALAEDKLAIVHMVCPGSILPRKMKVGSKRRSIRKRHK